MLAFFLSLLLLLLLGVTLLMLLLPACLRSVNVDIAWTPSVTATVVVARELAFIMLLLLLLLLGLLLLMLLLPECLYSLCCSLPHSCSLSLSISSTQAEFVVKCQLGKTLRQFSDISVAA